MLPMFKKSETDRRPIPSLDQRVPSQLQTATFGAG